MKVEKFLELAEKIKNMPNITEVLLLDFRMNGYYASGDGTPEGIYEYFGLEEIELGKMEDIYKVASITFTNDVDYDDDCNRILR
jgi:hypothetical protein